MEQRWCRGSGAEGWGVEGLRGGGGVYRESDLKMEERAINYGMQAAPSSL